MIEEIISILVKNNNKRNTYEEKLESYGMSNDRIVSTLFASFLKEYGGASVFTEDLMELISTQSDAAIDTRSLLSFRHMCTRKRRQALVAKFNKMINTYDRFTSFIMAIVQIEKDIKKTCNVK